MHKKLAVVSWAIFLVCGLTIEPGFAGAESIVGKWQVKAETPNGPIALEFNFRLDGSVLAGDASMAERSIPFAAAKFEDPNFTGEFIAGTTSIKLAATLKDGRLVGTWEQVGGDKGSWTAERKPPSPVSTSAAGGVAGIWDMVAATPGGEMAAALELKQEGDKITGEIRSERGSLPIQAASFTDKKLQFDLSIGDGIYRIQATLEGDKLTGGWSPAAGGEGGAWRATRKAAAAAPASTLGIVGTWTAVATSPEGNMQFQVEIKQTGDTLTGAMVTPDGSIPLQKPLFADNKLTFAVDFMGGTYRVEVTLANDRLTGKWAAVSGTDSGTLTAERKKP